jgi:hypothetical protein
MQFSRATVLCLLALLGAASAQVAPASGFLGQLEAGAPAGAPAPAAVSLILAPEFIKLPNWLRSRCADLRGIAFLASLDRVSASSTHSCTTHSFLPSFRPCFHLQLADCSLATAACQLSVRSFPEDALTHTFLTCWAPHLQFPLHCCTPPLHTSHQPSHPSLAHSPNTQLAA